MNSTDQNEKKYTVPFITMKSMLVMEGKSSGWTREDEENDQRSKEKKSKIIEEITGQAGWPEKEITLTQAQADEYEYRMGHKKRPSVC